MDTQKIQILVNGQLSEAIIKYDPDRLIMTFSEADNFNKVYQGEDIYMCLAKIRADFPHMIFLCKGAKKNVMPSRMASQMSAGLVAYEMTLGKQASRDDIVHIFDYEENNLTSDPQDQIRFFKEWLASLIEQDHEKFK